MCILRRPAIVVDQSRRAVVHGLTEKGLRWGVSLAARASSRRPSRIRTRLASSGVAASVQKTQDGKTVHPCLRVSVFTVRFYVE